ncbi:AraC family transcriptional regulator [Massilia sp. Root351]|jgi:AraC family transcriptional activator of pobA|uniref:helix-turn-helix domain-containing protein n=1 Tax=Massilia sp. Root351 TaxID=1736522 RepID=UPI00070DDE74|nr:helix-turn-helix domain-containing protein [Massilia sp. Root351]KQV82624.1 AraC family transcriptional regulator [Massilia sp. Root351]
MSRSTKPSRPEIPQFALYGEQTRGDGAEFVHIELIETRSRLHHWHIDKHTHAGLFQVLFLFGGEVRASIGGAVWERRAPAAITIHPSVVHGFDFSAEAHGYVLTVDQNVLFAAGGSHGDLYSPLFVEPLALDLSSAPECARLEPLLRQLLEEAAWPRHGHTLMLEWLARSALLLLVRVHAERRFADQSGRSDFELFSRFRAEVEQHYREQWQVGQYAAALRATPTRLNRLCLKLSGKSAFDIAQDRLMLEACRKLTYLPASIASIAYELGFQDPAYFSRLFKKRMGLTPKAFRAA